MKNNKKGSFSNILQANDRLLYQDRLGTITREIVFKGGGFSQMMLSMLMLALGVWQTPPTFWIDCFRFIFDCVCIQRSERRKIKQIIGCHNLSYLPRQAQDANIYIYIHYEKVHRGESCGPCVAQPRPRRFKQRRSGRGQPLAQ